MRKSFFGCLGAFAVAFILQASPAQIQAGLFDQCSPCDEAGECNPCDPCGDSDPCNPCDVVCKTKTGKFFVNGHIEAGVFANAHGSKNT
ncbi:MAG: hypothetical protein LBH00_11280, partial [Planctomycetaceae bacterium]|nr:hypothetical protein [Planctomycetaceae bacterium]